jgi:hypothetical protein
VKKHRECRVARTRLSLILRARGVGRDEQDRQSEGGTMAEH